MKSRIRVGDRVTVSEEKFKNNLLLTDRNGIVASITEYYVQVELDNGSAYTTTWERAEELWERSE